MKLIALLGAGVLAASSIVATAPADAQRYGYGRHDGYGNHHWRGGGYRHGWRGGYGRRGGYSRVVCRVHGGRYGPVRRCFRVYR